jgi:guanosine-3',5'-bis(diphosphate) 3'-pyrophosphohydrolase
MTPRAASAGIRSAQRAVSPAESLLSGNTMSDAIRLVTKAADFVARRHSGQKRKGASAPAYVNHLAEVAALVARPAAGDAELVAAAYLHDVVEDEHASAEEIREIFGARVGGLVDELTDDMSLPDEDRKRRQVRDIADKSPGARLIKLADKVSNVREMAEDPPTDWPREKRRAYADWAQKVVDAGCRGLDAELERQFDEAVAKVLRS